MAPRVFPRASSGTHIRERSSRRRTYRGAPRGPARARGRWRRGDLGATTDLPVRSTSAMLPGSPSPNRLCSLSWRTRALLLRVGVRGGELVHRFRPPRRCPADTSPRARARGGVYPLHRRLRSRARPRAPVQPRRAGPVAASPHRLDTRELLPHEQQVPLLLGLLSLADILDHRYEYRRSPDAPRTRDTVRFTQSAKPSFLCSASRWCRSRSHPRVSAFSSVRCSRRDRPGKVMSWNVIPRTSSRS